MKLRFVLAFNSVLDKLEVDTDITAKFRDNVLDFYFNSLSNSLNDSNELTMESLKGLDIFMNEVIRLGKINLSDERQKILEDFLVHPNEDIRQLSIRIHNDLNLSSPTYVCFFEK